MEQVIFKLKIDKTQGLWQLPMKQTFVKKIEKNGTNVGYRKIGYAPGTSSMFLEDLPKDIELEGIWFNNGQKVVAKDDTLLLNILKEHGWFDKYYEIWDANSADRKELESLELKNKVGRMIEDADTDKIKAIALAVFGRPAFNWGKDTCKLQLLKYADKEPLKLKKELEHNNYESKYLSALAFSKGIVTNNNTKTAVVWNDTTQGIILRLSKGEEGVHKLGEYLSTRTDESVSVLQEIGNRIESKEINIKADSKEQLSEKEEALKKAEQEIADLKAQLLAATPKDNSELTLKEARAKYVEKLKKEVPPNMKNNLVWLKNQLSEQ